MVVSAAVVSAASACASSSGTLADGTTNPPPPLAECPTAPPVSGAPCTSTTTAACTYDAGAVMNGCGTFPNVTNANCVGGKWQIGGSTMTCNPGLPPDAGTDAADSGDAGDGGDSG